MTCLQGVGSSREMTNRTNGLCYKIGSDIGRLSDFFFVGGQRTPRVCSAHERMKTNVYPPEVGTRMYDPVSGGFLSDAFLHEGLLAAEEFHGQFVVGGLEQRLQLVADEGRFGFAAHVGRSWTGSGFLLGRSVQTDVVSAKVDASAVLEIHLRRDVVGHERRFAFSVVQGRHQRIGEGSPTGTKFIFPGSRRHSPPFAESTGRHQAVSVAVAVGTSR